jgi:glycosyltransferase involved in cell wall biosynthesis
MYRIGIDYTPAYEQGGGIGRLVRDLIHALAQHDHENAYRLFVAGWQDPPPPLGDNFIWRGTRFRPKDLARLWHRLRLPVPIETFVGAVDLYHATDFVLPPVRKHTKTIVTVHDLSFVRVPEAASPSLKAYLDRVVPDSIARADHVIADSEATKRDIISEYGTNPAKITVLLSGIDARFQPENDSDRLQAVRAKYGIGEKPYFFSIGTVQPRKNYSRIIKALKCLRDDGYDVQLVIAGGRGWLEDEMYQTIAQTGIANAVKLIGFADDDDINALYSGSVGVVFTSLYEGFGFPVLEGLACGVPVITSNVSSLPEVAGDVALMVDPHDVDAIGDAMRRLLVDDALRQNMVERGFVHIQKFTWERSAKQLLNIYRKVLDA